MAEFVMRDLVEKRGLEDHFVIASAATSSEELGNPVHPGTRNLLAQHGIGCAGKTARRIQRQDYDDYDLIIGMDDANIRSLVTLFKGDPENKVYKMMEYAGSHRDVADPWYTHDFQTTYDDIYDGCIGLLGAFGV